MFALGAETKKAFFDTGAVAKALSTAKRRVFGRFGAMERTIAQRSIRRRKAAVSQPGQPPFSHEGSLRDNIWFAYDSAAESVVVGPTALNKVAFDADLRPVSGLIPEILEFGGTAGVIEQAVKVVDNTQTVGVMSVTNTKTERLLWVRRDLRRYGKVALLAKLRANLARGQVFRVAGNLVVPTGHNRFRTYHVAARPYMRPAFLTALGKLDTMWAGSVTAAGTGRAA